MKKMNKIFILLFIFIIGVNTIYATLGSGLDSGKLGSVTGNDQTLVNKFDNPLNNIFGTILTILQVLAVAGIVINGLRYMYAGSQDKGKIKQSLIYIIIGTILVFGTKIFVDIITGTWNTVK